MVRADGMTSVDLDHEIVEFLRLKKKELKANTYSDVLRFCIPELDVNDDEAARPVPKDSVSSNNPTNSRARRPPLIDADRVTNDDKLASWFTGLSVDARKWLFEVLGKKASVSLCPCDAFLF